MSTKLTKYPEGGVRELLHLSIPMILSALSSNFMIFIDRAMLAHYSLDAMNAVGASSTTFLVFSLTFLSITSIAEVFVGQLNGRKAYSKVSVPVWQMIWLSLFSALVFIGVSLFGANYIIPQKLHHYGVPYFKIMMNFGFLAPLIAAVSSFFIGTGKAKIITCVVLFGNIINLVLDYLLIFGIGDYLYPMGSIGAAYATVASQVIQALLLFLVFFNSANRQKYKTLNWKFNKHYFKQCFKIGFPGAISHASEIASWATLYYFATLAGNFYLTSLSIGQNVFVLFMFTIDGLEKGIISISSNLIGSKKYSLIHKMLDSSFKVYLVVMALLSVPLLIFPELVINLFDVSDFKGINKSQLITYLTYTLMFVWLYFLIDSLVWIYAGVLTAAGDTKIIMVANSTCSWLFGTIPFYFLVNKFNLLSPSYTFGILCAYATINLAIIYYRFKSSVWKQIKIN
ncbi:MAG: MATE family efflux transporter [Rickettsiales bacterium]